MPSSFTFLLNSQSDSSSSSSENDSNSDQSDDDDNDVGYYKKRTIQNDNDMLERPSDHDDSCSQSDDTDNDDDGKKNDIFTSSNNSRSFFLTRHATLHENDRPRKSSSDENNATNRREATLLDIERDNTAFLEYNQLRLFSPERSKSIGIVDKKQQSRNTLTSVPSELTASAQELYLIPKPDNNMQSPLPSRTTAKTITSPKRSSTISTKQVTNETTRSSISKIPIRNKSSSQSRSRSPAPRTTNHQSSTISSKIPVPISAISNGAFRFFTADDRPTSSSQIHSTTDSPQTTNPTTKKVSPFAPITNPKSLPSSSSIQAATTKKSSSAGNTPSAKHRRKQVVSSDEEDSETNNLKEADLKIKLKEQKRHGKQTGEILDKLHENYEELLEKYAQAENTIDQLRFQPKLFGDNTPPSNASEGIVHFIQQAKMNSATLRSNGVYHSATETPLSSIRQINSTTTTTTTPTPARKSTSPTNSGTAESVFFDEPVSQKIVVQELTTSETIKLDLLIQTKTLSDKMKSFLTLMDANQLSLAEQKQVYESIKDDYEKLLKIYDRTKRGSDLSDIDLDADLNKELEIMKQTLKEIVKRITDNLLGKSISGSETGRQSRLTHDGSHSSQISVRSSLCNHADLMDQYKKLLNAVNTEVVDKKSEMKSFHHGFETGSAQLKKTISRDSSQSDISGHLLPGKHDQKRYVYVSGNSDDEQQQQQSISTTPIPLLKGLESTSFNLDYIPSKRHQQINEERTHIHGITATTKKKKSTNKHESQEYDNLENITKSKRKTKTDQKKISNDYEHQKDLNPSSNRTGGARYSSGLMRTRTSDYDSGIGTNNTTKLSRDSKLNASTMDESHYQSLDEDQRRHSGEEQESMSSESLSRSSGSGTASPGSPYSKYTKRFDSPSSLRQHNDNYRRKPSGHSDVYSSDIETHITGSFDPLPSPPSYQKETRRSHHSWQPQQTISHRSRLTPFYRSVSNERIEVDTYKTRFHRPQTAPQISSRTAKHIKMGGKYQSGFIHRSVTQPETMYKSSFYIDQAHTHSRSQEKLDHNQRLYHEPTPARRQTYTRQANNLYLDSQTGIIYRYVPNVDQPPTITHYPTTSQVKSSARELYQCAECGSVTTYQHRHHMHSTTRRVITDVDDPGYESGNKITNRPRRYIDNLTYSDTDLDETPTYVDMGVLNEAYERAKTVQHRSQNLSRHVSRQLKLVLATI